MLTNADRLKLVQRLQELTHELSHITHILHQNPFPITDEDIERAVERIVDSGSKVVLSDLTEMIRDGIPASVLATYHPNSQNEQKLVSRSEHTDDLTLRTLQRLITLGHVVYAGTTADNLDAYAVNLSAPPAETESQPGSHTIEFSEEALGVPENALVRVGPQGRVRYLMTDEDIRKLLESTDNVSMLSLERSVTSYLNEHKDSDAVFYVSIQPVTSDAPAQ